MQPERKDRFPVQKQLCLMADLSSLLTGTAGQRHSDPAVSASSDGLHGRVSARSVLKAASHTLSLERNEKIFTGKRERVRRQEL